MSEEVKKAKESQRKKCKAVGKELENSWNRDISG